MAIMRTRNLVASTFSLFLCVGIIPARAEPLLDLRLINPDQMVTQGTTALAFDATILNPSATNTVYLNGDASATSSTLLTVDDSPFFLDAPLSLAPGESSGPFELFDVTLSSAAPVGTYSLNAFSILGGADGGTFSDFSDIADATFSVTVSPSVISVPEPDSLILTLGGLIAAAASLGMRRRVKEGMSKV
jgi:PEP-CTERM motif-containing protein